MKWTAEDSTLVILPGFNGTDALFAPFIAALPKNVNVHIVSYPTERLGDFNNYRKFVADRLRQFDSYIILAESFSGPIAVHALAQLQKLPRGIIFCASFLHNPRPFILSLTKLVPLGPLVKAASRCRFAYSLLLGSASQTEIAQDLSATISALPASTISERLKVMGQIPKEVTLNFSMPRSCYLQALQDRLVPRHCAKNFAKVFPDMEIREVSAPHFILQCAPCEAAREVCDFIATV